VNSAIQTSLTCGFISTRSTPADRRLPAQHHAQFIVSVGEAVRLDATGSPAMRFGRKAAAVDHRQHGIDDARTPSGPRWLAGAIGWRRVPVGRAAGPGGAGAAGAALARARLGFFLSHRLPTAA
jgi:hypothetical protein